MVLAALVAGGAGARTQCPALKAPAFASVEKAPAFASAQKASERNTAKRLENRREQEAPKGDLVYYNKYSTGTFVLNGQMYLYEDIFPAEVIWGENGKVYLKNLVSVFPADYYVEGTLEGNIITVPTNQTIEYFEEEGYGFNFGVLKTNSRNENGDVVYTFEYAPEITSIQFEVGADGSIELKMPGEPFDQVSPPEYVAGIYYSDDYEFTGYSDFTQTYERLDLQLVTMPEDAQIEKYIYIDEFSYASVVDVAYYGDYLYIRGLNYMLPDGTLRARIEGNKAYIPQNEFLGVYYDLFYISTKVVYDNPDYDENDEDSPPFIMAPANVEFELNLDRENRSIFADKEGVYLSFHCNENDFMNSLGYYGIFEMHYQASFKGVPSNPINLEYSTEWAEYQGWNDFFFTITNFSTEGSYLEADKLYYKVFLNGEPIVFVEELTTNLLGEECVAYQGVPIAVNLMPYYFDNNEDIFKFNDNIFDVGIYTNDVQTIGVQSIYYYEKEFTYSDIVTLNVATGEVTTESGVKAVSDSPTVAVDYLTLDGRRVANPDRGFYIEVSRKADGSAVARKVMK